MPWFARSFELRQATPAAFAEGCKRNGPGGLCSSLSLWQATTVTKHQRPLVCNCLRCLTIGSSWMYTPHLLTSSAARAQKSLRFDVLYPFRQSMLGCFFEPKTSPKSGFPHFKHCVVSKVKLFYLGGLSHEIIFREGSEWAYHAQPSSTKHSWVQGNFQSLYFHGVSVEA